jgi:uncharacterized membrane protein
MPEWIVLLGVALVVIGFVARLNPLLVVAVAGTVTALLGHLTIPQVLAAFGNGFAANRTVTIWVVTLPVIGLLERYGLQEQARRLIAKLGSLTTGWFLTCYQLIRQVTAAVGLTAIGGPAQTVRPLVAPMAEGATERKHGENLPDHVRERIKAFSASADTVGLFFGEDIFLAVGSILVITGYVDSTYHTQLEPLNLALWAIPTAVFALIIHGGRMVFLDRWIDREIAKAGSAIAAKEPVK